MAQIRESDVSDEEDDIVDEDGASSEESSSSEGVQNEGNADVGEEIFSPPLYRQRYGAVSSILELAGPFKRFLDAGCAEGTFISIYLKKFPEAEEIVGLDIDDFVLDEGKHRTAPLIYEHLHPRQNPLDIYLMQGDVGVLDERLVGVEAVSAIELIEHLYPESLFAFRSMVFGGIKPRIAVITTPNSEYNVLFPNLCSFRHPDHKFEWTREEFKTWCEGIVEEFKDYSVSYSGVGFSSERPELGPCSQIAIFTCLRSSEGGEPSYIRDSENIDSLYRTLTHHSYPVSKDKRSFEEKLLGNLEFYINDCCKCRPAWENDEDDHLSLSFLSKFSLVAELTQDVEVIRKTLMDNSWEVVELEGGEYHVVVPPLQEEYLPSSSYEDEDDEYNPDDFYVPDSNRNFIEDEDFWD